MQIHNKFRWRLGGRRVYPFVWLRRIGFSFCSFGGRLSSSSLPLSEGLPFGRHDDRNKALIRIYLKEQLKRLVGVAGLDMQSGLKSSYESKMSGPHPTPRRDLAQFLSYNSGFDIF